MLFSKHSWTQPCRRSARKREKQRLRDEYGETETKLAADLRANAQISQTRFGNSKTHGNQDV